MARRDLCLLLGRPCRGPALPKAVRRASFHNLTLPRGQGDRNQPAQALAPDPDHWPGSGPGAQQPPGAVVGRVVVLLRRRERRRAGPRREPSWQRGILRRLCRCRCCLTWQIVSCRPPLAWSSRHRPKDRRLGPMVVSSGWSRSRRPLPTNGRRLGHGRANGLPWRRRWAVIGCGAWHWCRGSGAAGAAHGRH